MRSSRWVPKFRLVDKDTEILKLARGKSVLHIGMGGFIDDPKMTDAFLTVIKDALHPKLAEVAFSVAGVDINPRTIAAMRNSVPGDYYVADICGRLPKELTERRFDVVVFADVIEHLDNFKAALENLRNLLKPETGMLILTTVNAYCFDSIFKMLFRYESCHEEHTCYFSWLTVKRLCEMNGLAISDFAFYQKVGHRRFDGIAHLMSYHVSGLFGRIFPQYAMGILAVTRKA